MHLSWRGLLVGCVLLAGITMPASAQEMPALDALSISASDTQPNITPTATRVYERFGEAVYQIQVIDRASGKKAGIGSGFQISADGLMATNYHVVAEAIRKPENNTLEYLHEDGARGRLSIVTVDVINDLAVLRMDKSGPVTLDLGVSTLPKGTRLFSMGNPHDIGFTIVEGIHNGAAADSFRDKIHFSGAINQGMSGGPTLTSEGRVVGINVMTGGNQIGFLVPVEALAKLIEGLSDNSAGDFMTRANAVIMDQLINGQARMMGALLDDKKEWPRVNFGPLSLPGGLHPALKCWGAPAHEDKDPFRHFWSTCYNEDSVYLSDGFDTGAVFYRYDLITANDDLLLPRFYTLYEQLFAQSGDGGNAGEGDVGNFTCHDSFIDLGGARYKSSYCLRGYKKFPMLYDAHLYLALVGQGRTGVIITVQTLGVTRESALAFARKFLANISLAQPASTAGDAGDAVVTGGKG